MCERKKTAVTCRAVKSNFQQVLLKTLIPTMNTLKDMAVLNIIKTDGKCAPEAKREDLELIQFINLNKLKTLLEGRFLLSGLETVEIFSWLGLNTN